MSLPTPAAERVLDVVCAIPAGQVSSYGEVARQAATSARAAGRALARYGGGVPWWRVVRADGRLAHGHEEQAAQRLAAEGVPVARCAGGWRVIRPDTA